MPTRHMPDDSQLRDLVLEVLRQHVRPSALLRERASDEEVRAYEEHVRYLKAHQAKYITTAEQQRDGLIVPLERTGHRIDPDQLTPEAAGFVAGVLRACEAAGGSPYGEALRRDAWSSVPALAPAPAHVVPPLGTAALRDFLKAARVDPSAALRTLAGKPLGRWQDLVEVVRAGSLGAEYFEPGAAPARLTLESIPTDLRRPLRRAAHELRRTDPWFGWIVTHILPRGADFWSPPVESDPAAAAELTAALARGKLLWATGEQGPAREAYGDVVELATRERLAIGAHLLADEHRHYTRLAVAAWLERDGGRRGAPERDPEVATLFPGLY